MISKPPTESKKINPTGKRRRFKPKKDTSRGKKCRSTNVTAWYVPWQTNRDNGNKSNNDVSLKDDTHTHFQPIWMPSKTTKNDKGHDTINTEHPAKYKRRILLEQIANKHDWHVGPYTHTRLTLTTPEATEVTSTPTNKTNMVNQLTDNYQHIPNMLPPVLNSNTYPLHPPLIILACQHRSNGLGLWRSSWWTSIMHSLIFAKTNQTRCGYGLA